MPKIWTATIDAHRDAVRAATLDATATLMTEHGLSSVTMSRIAKEAGIGRATLYKYFSDVESILVAWHERHVNDHLARLAEVRESAGRPGRRLEEALRAYALMTFERPHANELSAVLHRGAHLTHAHQRLNDLIRDLLADAAKASDVRDDIPPDELAVYCLHALSAASALPSETAVQHLVELTLTGVRRHP